MKSDEVTPTFDPTGPEIMPEEVDVNLALGPKSQAVMNGPQYTQRAKAREPSEEDLPSPHEDGTPTPGVGL